MNREQLAVDGVQFAKNSSGESIGADYSKAPSGGNRKSALA
jgi:hypothetical protein